jgi:hypothetical protein
MKTAITIIFTFLLTTVYGQTGDYKVLLDSAKTLFKGEKNLNQEELDRFDYYQVVSLLEKVIELNPKNSEARYFLGYTYSRINSRDGRGMINMNLELVKKSSEQFEKVNKLTPKYTDEIIVLDPYSKLSAEWGSMAMSYWHNNKGDSAIWAFREGKKRGGFGDFYLSINKAVLDLCSNNSILIASGDNFTIPLWYLQIVEGYRKDVSVIDVSLLNTTWYPSFLAKNGQIKFDLPQSVIDTIEYCKWSDTTISIGAFSWTVKPSYYEQYILRGDRVFLSMLMKNKFKREIYFTTAFTEDSRLSLQNYLHPLILIDKLNTGKNSKVKYKKYKTEMSKILLHIEKVNKNSQQELNFIDNIRYDILSKLTELIQNKKNKQAKELMILMDKFADDKKYPYMTEKYKEYADYLRGQL